LTLVNESLVKLSALFYLIETFCLDDLLTELMLFLGVDMLKVLFVKLEFYFSSKNMLFVAFDVHRFTSFFDCFKLPQFKPF
jgi:hypothetical protein